MRNWAGHRAARNQAQWAGRRAAGNQAPL